MDYVSVECSVKVGVAERRRDLDDNERGKNIVVLYKGFPQINLPFRTYVGYK
jgi:hypothetical protein